MTQDRKELLREKMITRIPDCDMELVEELLAEERDLQNKLKEIAINNLITDVNTARKEERNAVLSEVEREVEQAKRYDFGGYPDDRYMEEEFDGEYMNYKDISTILNNLRVK